VFDNILASQSPSSEISQNICETEGFGSNCPPGKLSVSPTDVWRNIQNLHHALHQSLCLLVLECQHCLLVPIYHWRGHDPSPIVTCYTWVEYAGYLLSYISHAPLLSHAHSFLGDLAYMFATEFLMPPYCLHDCHYFYRTALRLLSIATLLASLYA